MPDLAADMLQPEGGFPIRGMMMRYNLFAPRLYNWCKSLGFEAGKIMPSRAFCSDESQGYPIIMLAKHFGTFPFNHGRVGGIVATDRHGPHASHGQDLVIIQASHVGYDPQTRRFGTYRRLQTTDQECGSNCGKIHHVILWYQDEYQFCRENVLLHHLDGKPVIVIDNQLLREDRPEGLILRLNKLVELDANGLHRPVKMLSTAKVYTASAEFTAKVGKSLFTGKSAVPINDHLSADLFFFRRNISPVEEGSHHLEHNLIRFMHQIITNPNPTLIAAQINTQIEFDRTFRTIVKEHGYQGKRILFIAGLNIDISPQSGQLFPLTKFIPWAAYVQEQDGSHRTIEQEELLQTLTAQSTENPDQIDLEEAIQIMADATEVKIEL
ncbi:MAG: hypothetical protein OEZ39_18670 [Gammaproteobacteria bacterium]|nr:hypothetical protein [Gammaproteobacteria bacterium]MDH5653891.1 hypothetical protein [Gammaproteobacteria bacterium]